MRIVIIKDGEKNAISIKKFIDKYDPMLQKICRRWIHSFYFDKAITINDLLQDLRIKLLNDLHNYDSSRGSLFTFVKKIANNFFINKRMQLLISDRYPVSGDKTILTIKSLYQVSNPFQEEEPNSHFERELIIDTIKSEEFSPEEAFEYNSMVEDLRFSLNKVKYNPRNFVRRRKSFVLKVFDILHSHNEKLCEQILFDHRCKIRCYNSYATVKKPNKIFPRASSIANTLGVDIRTVNKAFKIIRQAIEIKGNGGGEIMILTTEGDGYGKGVCKKERIGKIRRTPYKKDQEIQA
jgi:DNA-directed RNA polymerase specialized sigma24 family protein